MERTLESFTAFCYQRLPILSRSEHKKIILDSLKFLVTSERILLYGFVIMPNYIKILWSRQDEWNEKNVQQIFLKFTAQRMKHFLKTNHRDELELYRSNRTDRLYQFWERKNAKKQIQLYADACAELALIHIAPCDVLKYPSPQNYPYSSARFYTTGEDKWKMLVRLSDHAPSSLPVSRSRTRGR
ncbi:hypothetical protein MKQ70_28960 [Chitinophaga sedimenti]|uniref:hypothetical protein n=1 Tax=Chitinophaga sedimenti TaxID=2033606 RepID=UPI0020065883|nr:hypothetical protein [Chitinophaga sedimenti]MCK7558796.1 hypothetical protein [Chitinophaga sedimenti]